MAIIRIPDTETDEKLGLEFNNGDYQALKGVVSSWGFKDVESAIRFGIAVLVKSGDHKQITLKDSSGEKVSIQPADSLLRTKDGNGNEEAAK